MSKGTLLLMASGNGSNFQAIANAFNAGQLRAFNRIVLLCDNASAYVLKRAENVGIKSYVLAKERSESSADYQARLLSLVHNIAPYYICLVGWMRLLSNAFIQNCKAKIINLHPALPEAFPGTNAIERAYKAWHNGTVTETGVMVHYVVDEGVDDGPVIATEKVALHQGDSLQCLEERVHALEHTLIVKVLNEIK